MSCYINIVVFNTIKKATKGPHFPWKSVYSLTNSQWFLLDILA